MQTLCRIGFESSEVVSGMLSWIEVCSDVCAVGIEHEMIVVKRHQALLPQQYNCRTMAYSWSHRNSDRDARAPCRVHQWPSILKFRLTLKQRSLIFARRTRIFVCDKGFAANRVATCPSECTAQQMSRLFFCGNGGRTRSDAYVFS